jgi:5'(3')-deoxyribonucleotidase
MPKIIIDVDDTIADLRTAVCEFATKHKGQKIDENHFVTQDVNDFICWEHVEDHIINNNVLLELKPEPGAEELLRHLRISDYEIILLTARGYHPQGKEITEKWMSKNALPYDEIICVEYGVPKHEIISNLGEVDLYLDDHLKHIENSEKLKNLKTAILVDRPWNRSAVVNKRIKHLNEVLDHIREE